MKIKRLIKKVLPLFLLVFCLFCNNLTTANANEQKLYLGGNVLGFTLKTEGATVVGISDVVTEKGLVSPCKNAGLKIGDVILNMNNTQINSINDVNSILKNYNQGEIVTKINRQGEIKLLDLVPIKDLSNSYKLGLYLRDDLSGLGTVTYYKDDGSFASLGHPVTDEKGELYKITGGNVFLANVIGVCKPENKRAGELKGVFVSDKPIGSIIKNSDTGLYGSINDFSNKNLIETKLGKAMQGKAQIYSTIDGNKPRLYDIEIIKVDLFCKGNKNLVIRITDKNLLECAGGILQGMSGSPIIQNGKLVGAVTHVFINDPTTGYGISISKMIHWYCLMI